MLRPCTPYPPRSLGLDCPNIVPDSARGHCKGIRILLAKVVCNGWAVKIAHKQLGKGILGPCG